MALKAKIDKLEDVPQEDRKHYKKIDLADGKVEFIADIEKVGGMELADTGGLLKSLEKERANGAKLARYGTITPEEATSNAAKVVELSEQLERKGSKGGDAQELVKQATNELARAHGEVVKKLESQSAARLAEVVRLRRTEAARKEAAAVGFEESAVELIAPFLEKDIDVVEDEKGFRSVVKGEDGRERIVSEGSGGVRPMTPADRARELAADPKYKRYLAPKEKPKAEPTPQSQPFYRPDAPAQSETRPYNATESIGRAFARASATR